MATLKISSELLQNYRETVPVDTNKTMTAVCDEQITGFLNVSGEGKLKLIYQKDATASGWESIDITPSLAESVTDFCLVRDRIADNYVLILIDSKNHIFISKASISSPVWTEIPTAGKLGKDAALYKLKASSYNGSVSISLFTKENSRINCYPILVSSSEIKWKNKLFPDFNTIIDNVSGRAARNRIDGIYTFGQSSIAENQMLFTPYYNIYDEEQAPLSIRLLGVSKTDKISALTSPKDSQYTDVFSCGNGRLSLLTYDKQVDGNRFDTLVNSIFFTDVLQLYTFISKDRVYVWALNESKYLTYLFAPVESYDNPGSWSEVCVLRENVQYVYPYKNGDVNAMLAYGTDNKIYIGNESPESGIWNYNGVYVQDAAQKNVTLVNSYVTLIKTPEPNREVTLKASVDCTVNINGAMYNFKKNPITVKSDMQSKITITDYISDTGTLSSPVFTAELNGEKANIDPVDFVSDRYLNLNTPSALKNAEIKYQDKRTEQLVPHGTDGDTLKAVAGVLDRLKQAKNSNRDSSGFCMGAGAADISTTGIALHFGDGKISYTEITDSKKDFVTAANSQGIVYSSEDVLGFLRALNARPRLCAVYAAENDGVALESNSFWDLIVDFVNGVWQCIIKIGEKIIAFVIDCAEKIAAIAVTIFEYIKVAIEKIIEFIKFIFDFDDICNCKDVMEKVFVLGITEVKNQIPAIKTTLIDNLSELEKMIDEWAGLANPESIDILKDKSFSAIESENSFANNSDVRSNHFLDLVKNSTPQESVSLRVPFTAELEGSLVGLFEELHRIYDGQEEIIDDIIRKVKLNFGDFSQLTTIDVNTLLVSLKKVCAIVGGALIDEVKLFIDVILNIVYALLDSLISAIQESVYIPGISEILKLFDIKLPSWLDIICFIPAFFGTIVYKLIKNAPLVSKELHDEIMSFKSITEFANLSANSAVMCRSDLAGSTFPQFNRPCYTALKCISAAASFAECVFGGLDMAGGGKVKMFGYISMGLGVVDGVFYVACSFLVYAPMGTTLIGTSTKDARKPLMPLCVPIIFTVIKYLPKACVAIKVVVGWTGKGSDAIKEMLENSDKPLKAAYAITSGISIVYNIAGIILASKNKSYDKKEHTLYYVENASLICDNGRNICDGIGYYLKSPLAVGIAITVRSILGGAYSALQIAEGSLIY